MAKVTVRKLTLATGEGEVRDKRVFTPTGEKASVPAIDANSDSFSADLHRLFKRNVAKARKENRKLFGSADRVD
jgi:hypothetical protein